MNRDEPPLEPDRPIVDPHHHFWDHPGAPGRFLLPELLQIMADSGHRFTHTVFLECHSMYRRYGPAELRPVGETEFVNGIAAMAASGRYGECLVAAGIVGSADLLLGAEVAPVLEAQIAAGNGRFRGVRNITAHTDAPLFGRVWDPGLKGILANQNFRSGVRALGRYGLVLDVWVLHPQLPEVSALAAACADTTIVLNHLGTPLDFGPYAHRKAEAFDEWRTHMTALARQPNVFVKLGGLGMDLGAPLASSDGNTPSSQLASAWRPYIEACVNTFGPRRCMFESNFPPDRTKCSYGALWNAFKLVSAAYSESEKTALFSGTATSVYRLA